MNPENKQDGFIGILISIVAALVLAQAVFHIDVVSFLRSPSTLEVVDYIKRAIVLVWDKFLVLPVSFIWEQIFVDIIWKGGVYAFDMLKGWVDSQ